VENPLVSVVIPSHNRFEGLLHALESVKKQSLTDYEVIVINDGSDDERYLDYNFDIDVKVIHLKMNSVKEKGYFSDRISKWRAQKQLVIMDYMMNNLKIDYLINRLFIRRYQKYIKIHQ